jgi:hypothetical protein
VDNCLFENIWKNSSRRNVAYNLQNLGKRFDGFVARLRVFDAGRSPQSSNQKTYFIPASQADTERLTDVRVLSLIVIFKERNEAE